MVASLVTLLALGCFLLWIFQWQRRPQLAAGIAIGVLLGAIGAPLLGVLGGIQRVPIWVPVLPFALIAISLFSFGMLAWFWGED